MTERTFMDKFHDFRYTTFGRIALFGLFMSPVFIAQAYSHFTTPDLDKNRKELANIVNEHRGHGCMAPDLFLKSQIDKYEDLEKEMYGLKTEIKDLLEEQAINDADFIKHSTSSLLDRGVINEFASVDIKATYILWLYEELNLGRVEGFENKYVFLRTSEFPEEAVADIKKLSDYKNGIKKLVDEIYKHDMDEFSPEALIAVISHYQLMRNNEKAVTYGSDVVQDVFVRFFNDYFPKMKFEDFITSEEKRLEAIGRIGSEILKSQADYTF